jgi:hypothetical protein
MLESFQKDIVGEHAAAPVDDAMKVDEEYVFR